MKLKINSIEGYLWRWLMKQIWSWRN